MENDKHGTKSFMQKPAFRIGVVVLVIHTICWIGWNVTQRGADSHNSAAIVQKNHEKIRAAIEK
ncbi:hypothetical protein KR222_003395 [Zaprionus bogoriensis]|nr:hypothetical protein KR222_003395 [Zaprionus bogoriensis]